MVYAVLSTTTSLQQGLSTMILKWSRSIQRALRYTNGLSTDGQVTPQTTKILTTNITTRFIRWLNQAPPSLNLHLHLIHPCLSLPQFHLQVLNSLQPLLKALSSHPPHLLLLLSTTFKQSTWMTSQSMKISPWSHSSTSLTTLIINLSSPSNLIVYIVWESIGKKNSILLSAHPPPLVPSVANYTPVLIHVSLTLV